MAEGLLKGILGDESEEEAQGAATDPVLANTLARSLAPDSQEARLYLKDARRMIQLQIETLHEVRQLDLKHLRTRRWRDGLQLAFQLLGVAIAAAVGLTLAIVLRDAFTARSVVVEAFGAPPALASRGLSGTAVAEGLLDKLSVLQNATRSSAAKRNLSNAWTGDIKVEVPETGVSIGELAGMLKKRFGHDQHIGGDLLQTDTGGLELTVRGDRILPKTFAGGAGDLAKLETQAAEYVFGQAEPGLYTAYLDNASRPADAIAFAKAAYSAAPKEDRPYILNAWGNALGNVGAPPTATLVLYRAALKLKPDFWVAYNNVMNATWALGHEEEAWRTSQVMFKAAGGRPGKAPEYSYQNSDTMSWNLLPWRAGVVANAEANGGIGTGTSANGVSVADIDMRLHDATEAELQLQTARGDDAGDPTIPAMSHFVRGRLAADAGDRSRALTEMEAFQAGYANPIVGSNYPGYTCWIAPVEEAAGHPDKADAVLKAAGSFVDCYRFRGDILDRRGDWKGAQAAYAQAVALAPDMPAGDYSWGLALARHGDLAGAEVKLAAAHQRGPHWADPLKAWGDLLARQGRWKEALGKYDEAVNWAPVWAELRQARAAAAKRAAR
jgi:tetratricopeptide (TPR) repeat protein